MVGVENSRSYKEGKDVLREACPAPKGKDVWTVEAKSEMKANVETNFPLISSLWRGMTALSSLGVLGPPF